MKKWQSGKVAKRGAQIKKSKKCKNRGTRDFFDYEKNAFFAFFANLQKRV